MTPASAAGQTGMENINLAELYDAPPMVWDDVEHRLDARYPQQPGSEGPGRHTSWLTSLNCDGSPHANAVGSVWVDRRFWFVTGLGTRRGRNLRRDPRCLLALSLRELDLVVEGRAVVVSDPERLAQLAQVWAD